MAKGIKHIISTSYSYLLGRIIERTESEVSPCLEVTHMNGKYMLNSLNSNYSCGMLQKVFEIEFDKIKLKERKIKDVLVLGFGAGSVASILLEDYKMDCNITGVEKDEKVISLGLKYFNTSRFKNTNVINADAVDFMMQNKELFDLVVIDVYVDNLVPQSCETESFLKQVKKSLHINGLVVFNKMIFDEVSDRSAKRLFETFSRVMGNCTYHNIQKSHTNMMIEFENIPS
ncbi:MAG: methyltransferase domain-containing protein [Bacteroidales bacterium]|jgi:spermidine synthase